MRIDAVVGLGTNLGDREGTLVAAVRELSLLGAIRAVSRVYETEPVGPPQPRYLNAAVRLETGLSPVALLEALLAIERAHGRVRDERWGPRILDLDVLWIAGMVVDEAELRVPHPRLHERAFALVPLLEVAPDATDPRTGRAFDVPSAAGVTRIALTLG